MGDVYHLLVNSDQAGGVGSDQVASSEVDVVAGPKNPTCQLLGCGLCGPELPPHSSPHSPAGSCSHFWGSLHQRHGWSEMHGNLQAMIITCMGGQEMVEHGIGNGFAATSRRKRSYDNIAASNISTCKDPGMGTVV